MRQQFFKTWIVPDQNCHQEFPKGLKVDGEETLRKMPS
jgi:hypothetical protein